MRQITDEKLINSLKWVPTMQLRIFVSREGSQYIQQLHYGVREPSAIHVVNSKKPPSQPEIVAQRWQDVSIVNEEEVEKELEN